MENLTFKTNINCGGCIAKVTPTLNNLVGVNHWKVDTTGADKILTIENNAEIKPDHVIATLLASGFKAEKAGR